MNFKALSWWILSILILEPQFSFERSEYMVDESEQQLKVGIRRTGTDLSKPSSVTIRSRMTNPKSAQGQQLSLNCIEE